MKSLTKQTARIYWEHTKRYLLFFNLSILSIVGYTTTGLLAPFWYKIFFDQLAAKNTTDNSLISILLVILAINIFNWLFHRSEAINTTKYQSNTMSDLLNSCFEYLQGHSYNYFNNNFAGSLVLKVNRFARSYEDIADQLILNLGQTAVRVVGIIIVLFFKNIYLGLGLLIWGIIFISVNYWFALYRLRFDLERAKMDTKVTGHLSDTVANNMNLKLFGGIGQEKQTFKKLTTDLRYARQRSWMMAQNSEAVQGTFMVLLEFGVMYTAVKLWQQGLLTIGDFVLIQAYLIQIFQQLWNVGRAIRRLYESLADANEMTEVLLTPHEITDSPNAAILAEVKGRIEFKNVTFAYHSGKNVFNNLSLVITPGERVAFIGPSGGGKTTITKLLFRFFDITGGEIYIDKHNISTVTQESLRAHLALVPQEPILFHRSLLENIRYAKPKATDEQVFKAAQLAHCHEFISAFPDRYETLVGERGVKLSGGERQRVAIARAILKDAPVLVLDEATSSLDSESESYIQDALQNLMRHRTTIVIAHRLSTIMQMDRIIVIENGTITEQGKHEELLKAKQGTYQKLWEIQAGGFSKA